MQSEGMIKHSSMRPIHRLAVLAVLLSTLPSQADFKAEDKNGRIEIRDYGSLVFGWQYQLRKDAVGGETNPLFPALQSGQRLFQEPSEKANS